MPPPQFAKMGPSESGDEVRNLSHFRKTADRSNGTYKAPYLYRDAGNYKFWGEFCVAGMISMDDLKPYLLDGEYLVLKKIDVPSLVPEARNDDDHTLHEFDSIVPTQPSGCVFTAAEFIGRIRAVSEAGWFRWP